MATADAIAFVGDTVASLLKEGLNGLVLPGDILLSTPEAFKDFSPSQPTVTIFLYNVGVNGEMRNAPRVNLAAGDTRRPALPIELRFMVTPWTNTPGKPVNVATRETYRILGAITQVFYDRTILTFPELLGDQVWTPDDTVEIMMESLPVEQHYHIWEASDIPYRLSLTYLARVIGIDSAITTPATPVTVARFRGGVQ